MRCDAARRALAALALGALAALGGGGCNDKCTRNSDCADDLVCGPVGGCVVPPDAAPSGDGGVTPPTDGGPPTDAGEPADAAPIDAAVDAAPEPDAAF